MPRRRGATDKALSDKALGMDRSIDRRDFLNGLAIGLGAVGAGWPARARPVGGRAPGRRTSPATIRRSFTGLRGSHPGSFENAHALRDGDFWPAHSEATDTGERYDSGGRRRDQRPGRRTLLPRRPARRPHPDPGQSRRFRRPRQAQRVRSGRQTAPDERRDQDIDSPRPYSPVAAGLMQTLGIDPTALSKACDRDQVYDALGLGNGVFFDKESFGADRMVAGPPDAASRIRGVARLPGPRAAVGRRPP